MKNYNSGLQKLKKNNTNRIRKSETQGQNLLIYKWKFYLENNSQQDKKKQRKKKASAGISNNKIYKNKEWSEKKMASTS